eukprot:scaffold39935_cov222-Skeletonema_dohrnii-CCMP3373.AAC.1
MYPKSSSEAPKLPPLHGRIWPPYLAVFLYVYGMTINLALAEDAGASASARIASRAAAGWECKK